MKAKRFAHRVPNLGPGGWRCPCCGPSPRHRRKTRQQQRRIFSRLIDKIERLEAREEF